MIATTEESKKRIVKSVQGNLKFNEAKILNTSHVVLFYAKTSVDETYKNHIAESEAKIGRFPND